MAFDHSGNLFVSSQGTNKIQQYTPGGAGTIFASTGLNSPAGLAFDNAGALYAVNSGSANIQKFTGGGAGTIFADSSAGLSFPDFLAFKPAPVKATRVSGFATGIPGGTGNFTSLPGAPGYSSSGAVAFYGAGSGGQAGIYRSNTGPPIKVADLNTAIPGGTGNFTAFFSIGPPIIPAIDGSNVAFFGAGSGGQQGIYVMAQGPPIRIADTATAIPGGTGDFTSFGDVSLSSTDVAFLGFGASGQEGIYDMTGGTLFDMVDLNDILDGRAITALSLSRTGVSGDPIAFQATFADGSQGIYSKNVAPEPSGWALLAAGTAPLLGLRRRRSTTTA